MLRSRTPAWSSRVAAAKPNSSLLIPKDTVLLNYLQANLAHLASLNYWSSLQGFLTKVMSTLERVDPCVCGLSTSKLSLIIPQSTSKSCKHLWLVMGRGKSQTIVVDAMISFSPASGAPMKLMKRLNSSWRIGALCWVEMRWEIRTTDRSRGKQLWLSAFSGFAFTWKVHFHRIPLKLRCLFWDDGMSICCPIPRNKAYSLLRHW